MPLALSVSKIAAVTALLARDMSAKARAWAESRSRVQVGIELNGASIGDAQPFPNGIATLDHTVEDVDLGIFSRHQAIDPAEGAGRCGGRVGCIWPSDRSF